MSGLTGMPSMGMGMPSVGANEWQKHMSDLGLSYYYNARTGSCKYGQTCKFDYPPEMLGVVSAGVQAVELTGGQHPIRPGAKKCSFFLKTGSCKFGETCKFDHPPEIWITDQ